MKIIAIHFGNLDDKLDDTSVPVPVPEPTSVPVPESIPDTASSAQANEHKITSEELFRLSEIAYQASERTDKLIDGLNTIGLASSMYDSTFAELAAGMLALEKLGKIVRGIERVQARDRVAV
jgi:hypothetical protein